MIDPRVASGLRDIPPAVMIPRERMLAAFRQTFAGGRDLSERDTVLIAAAACEMHPTALLKSIGLRSVQAALDRAVSRARTDAVNDLPALRLGESLFTGEGLLEEAIEAFK